MPSAGRGRCTGTRWRRRSVGRPRAPRRPSSSHPTGPHVERAGCGLPEYRTSTTNAPPWPIGVAGVTWSLPSRWLKRAGTPSTVTFAARSPTRSSAKRASGSRAMADDLGSAVEPVRGDGVVELEVVAGRPRSPRCPARGRTGRSRPPGASPVLRPSCTGRSGCPTIGCGPGRARPASPATRARPSRRHRSRRPGARPRGVPWSPRGRGPRCSCSSPDHGTDGSAGRTLG